MPIRVRYKNESGQECTIRPTPLISINTTTLKNGAGDAYGVTYAITLTGTLLPEEGSPYALCNIPDSNKTVDGQIDSRYKFFDGTPPNAIGPYGAFDSSQSHTGASNRPLRQRIPQMEEATAILSKQRAMRALFAQDGQRMEITDINEDLPAVICYPRITNISFSEGTYVNRSDYTVTLEADVLLHRDPTSEGKIDAEGSMIPNGNGASDFNFIPLDVSEDTLINAISGAFIANFNESWNIELDDAQGETLIDGAGNETGFIPRGYRISHNLSATGKTHYFAEDPSQAEVTKSKAWENARKFVTNRLKTDATQGYPNILGKVGSGTLNLIESYGGFNLIRTESVDETAGSFSVTENWVLASGQAFERYNISTNTSVSDPFVSVSIDGSIKGLTTFSPSGEYYGGTGGEVALNGNRPYDNAINKYNQITNSGFFGISSNVYKRANNTVAVQLNSQPTQVTIGTNEFNGEITYSLAFNNRPTNIISGVISENISVNDTYPGDVFAVIPVLGRETGPILQYIGGRTEYKRDVALNLVMDYTKIPYASGRNPLLLKKPSIVEPTASQIADVLKQLSPQFEPGIRKCFVSPPSESWSPKEGTYSFNVSWTYELDK